MHQYVHLGLLQAAVLARSHEELQVGQAPKGLEQLVTGW